MTDRQPRVRVLPADISFEVSAEETIMSAANRAGYHWPTTCGGQSECGLCAFVAEEGVEHLSPMDVPEEATLALAVPTATTAGRDRRLACRVRVTGDVVVFKRGVREAI